PGTFRFVTVPRRPRRRGGEGALLLLHRKTGGKGITRRVSLPGTGTRRGRAPSAPPSLHRSTALRPHAPRTSTTGTGAERFVRVPSPTCPAALTPQQNG